MQIRPLVDADIPAVSALVCAVARSCILHQSAQAAAQAFLAENDDAGLRGFLAQGHVYHVALIDGELAGVVAVRDNSHLVRLFVATKRQRLGVARRLWQVARAEAIARGGYGVYRQFVEPRGGGVRIVRLCQDRADAACQGLVLQPDAQPAGDERNARLVAGVRSDASCRR